jgi:hypothetical protein
MIVLGHVRGLIILGGISISPTGGHSVVSLVLDGAPPLFQSLLVLPKVLRGPLIIWEILVPAENRQSVLDSDLQVPRDLRYAICSFGVEESEVS